MVIPKYLPPGLLIAGFAWWVLFEWIRHRSFRKHFHVGYTPGARNIATFGTLGALAFVIAGLALIVWQRTRG